jgi:hypothetical protein
VVVVVVGCGNAFGNACRTRRCSGICPAWCGTRYSKNVNWRGTLLPRRPNQQQPLRPNRRRRRAHTPQRWPWTVLLFLRLRRVAVPSAAAAPLLLLWPPVTRPMSMPSLSCPYPLPPPRWPNASNKPVSCWGVPKLRQRRRVVVVVVPPVDHRDNNGPIHH